MGREIRRVPVDWEHPRDHRGHHIPLRDHELIIASHAPMDVAQWRSVRSKSFDEYKALYQAEYPEDYEEIYGGDRPMTPDEFMPFWSDDEATGWCMYETVSEGTPVTPVFPDPESLHAHLVEQGNTPEQAAQFIRLGSAPTFAMGGGQIRMDIDALPPL